MAESSDKAINAVTPTVKLHVILFLTFADTVEPVLKDHPIVRRNVVCQDRWSLVTGSVTLNVGPSANNVWSVKTGGRSWQLFPKIGFTVCKNFHIC